MMCVTTQSTAENSLKTRTIRTITDFKHEVGSNSKSTRRPPVTCSNRGVLLYLMNLHAWKPGMLCCTYGQSSLLSGANVKISKFYMN